MQVRHCHGGGTCRFQGKNRSNRNQPNWGTKSFGNSGQQHKDNDILKVDNSHWDYVKIQPALLDIVSWNGDDDGTGYVASGDVSLIGPSGNVLSTTTLVDQVITGKFSPPPPGGPGDPGDTAP